MFCFWAYSKACVSLISSWDWDFSAAGVDGLAQRLMKPKSKKRPSRRWRCSSPHHNQVERSVLGPSSLSPEGWANKTISSSSQTFGRQSGEANLEPSWRSVGWVTWPLHLCEEEDTMPEVGWHGTWLLLRTLFFYKLHWRCSRRVDPMILGDIS